MKTRNALTLFLLILTALTLTACGKDKEGSDSSVISVSEKAEEGSDDPAEEQPSSSSSQEDQTKDNGSETNQKDEETDYINIYAPILDMTCDVIYNGYQDDKDYDLVPSGVLEMAGWMEKDELLESLGYIISDINKDGIMELMIGTLSNRDEIPMIFAGYTVKDNEPLNFLEGWYRSAYQYMDNGRFYYFGSGGAMYSAFGTYHINEDGTELVCEDFYFTGEKDNDPESIAFYHNTTGEWDSENSEELKLSEDDFWKISDELSSKCHAPDLIPFADYEYKNAVSGSADPLIEVDYLNDVADKYPSSEDRAKYMSSLPSEYAVNVLI